MEKEELQAIRHRAEMAESTLSCTKDWETELALCDALEQAQAENIRLQKELDAVCLAKYGRKNIDVFKDRERYRQALENVKAILPKIGREYWTKEDILLELTQALEGSE